MSIRDQIVSKVQELPESALPAVYEFVEKMYAQQEKPGLLKRLQRIKIEGPPDFSRNIDLYLNGEKDIEENIR